MANEKRLIDANALIEKLTDSTPHGWGESVPYIRSQWAMAVKIKDNFLKAITEASTVDSVEVVRCKDCKHWKPSGSMAGNREDALQPIGGCEWANCCRKEMDFCSYGERREGE